MPPKSNTEKIDELIRAVESLSVRLDAIEADLNRTREQKESLRSELHENAVRLSGMEKQLPDAKELVEIRKQLAVLESKVDDLRKSREEWGRRLWMIVPPILAAILGVISGLLIKR